MMSVLSMVTVFRYRNSFRGSGGFGCWAFRNPNSGRNKLLRTRIWARPDRLVHHRRDEELRGIIAMGAEGHGSKRHGHGHGGGNADRKRRRAKYLPHVCHFFLPLLLLHILQEWEVESSCLWVNSFMKFLMRHS